MKKATCHPDKKHYCKGLCKTCYVRKFKEDNPTKQAEYQRRHGENIHKYMLKHRFGITPEFYADLFEKQDGVCAICKKKESKGRRLSVDHNHDTGKVRSLLCQKCNSIIGMSQDNTETLRSAIKYLDNHKEN